MIAFWWPKTWQQRHYRVLVRPTAQGEFLVFPFAWRQGGKGYVLNLTHKRRLEAGDWRWYDGGLLALVLTLFWLLFVLGLWIFPPLFLVMAGWNRDLQKRYARRAAAVLRGGRFAGVVLTKARYELEYASQLSRSELWAVLAFAGAALFAGSLGIVAAVPGPLDIGVGLALVWGAAVFFIRRQCRLLKAHHQAFRFGIKAGDIVDMPLPAE